MKDHWGLDLFCCAGGATRGYQNAGFKMVGVDHKPQKRYVGEEFIQGDALQFLQMIIETGGIDTFDFIHASPPCQGYTSIWALHKYDHPMLIPQTRELLMASGRTWILENVERAPLLSESGLFGIHGIMLCGSSMGLKVKYRGSEYELRRHRLFESNIHLKQGACNHRLPVIGVYGHGESKAMRGKRGFQISTVGVRRKVMEMPWANRDEIAEAIPPAYTEFIGRQIMEMLRQRD